MNRKNIAYKKFVGSKLDSDFGAFLDLSDESNVRNEEPYNSFISKTGEDLRSNPKKFWTLINSMRGCKGLPSFMKYQDQTISDDEEQCNLFAKFFQQVYVKTSNTAVCTVPRDELFEPSSLLFTREELYSGFLKLDHSFNHSFNQLEKMLLYLRSLNLCAIRLHQC